MSTLDFHKKVGAEQAIQSLLRQWCGRRDLNPHAMKATEPKGEAILETNGVYSKHKRNLLQRDTISFTSTASA
ncbi:hypothetical protein [Intestinimonas massiliensis (ex Afouda et al. 2020)]|uniref:hypothetical protein n=1 Tax=Intestinimonas massiliensis (ex Afouda et al. 2020) TaxID=1673721 RepID=UPI00102F2F20|nr:hypothetical protein [Intestinimonas massiliensis (ex Afouda et al. 2020)]